MKNTIMLSRCVLFNFFLLEIVIFSTPSIMLNAWADSLLPPDFLWHKSSKPFLKWKALIIQFQRCNWRIVLALVLSAKKYARQLILWTVWVANISQGELFSWVLSAYVQNLLWDFLKNALCQILNFVGKNNKKNPK